MEIGKTLQSHRKKKGLTQEQLAKILNVSRQTISKWETNRGFPDIENLIWLCDIYEISLDQLVGRKQVTYEVQEMKKKNRRKDMFFMFPKHTGKVLLVLSLIIAGFIGYGVRSIETNRQQLEEIGLVKVYSIIDVTYRSDGKYDLFTLENGEVIDATEKNIEEYGLLYTINKSNPSHSNRASSYHEISIRRLREE